VPRAPEGVSPLILVVLRLILAAEFVNGWTDASNAIATVVSTRVRPGAPRRRTSSAPDAAADFPVHRPSGQRYNGMTI
jgi:hypothetical protein